jgi:rubrerythrin
MKQYSYICSWRNQLINELAIEVLKDIADEERVHAGEFLRLLKELDPEEKKVLCRSAEEVEEEIEKLKKK